MKTTGTTLALLALTAASAWADVSKEDIKKLAAAGVSDTVIVAFIKANGPAPKLTADELIELKGAGVSDSVVEALIAAASPDAPRPSVRVPELPRTEPAPAPERVVVVERPVYVPQTTYVVPSTTYYVGPSVGVSYCWRHRLHHHCSTYVAPSYGYHYSYGTYSTYYRPSWGLSWSSSRHCGRGWSIRVGW